MRKGESLESTLARNERMAARYRSLREQYPRLSDQAIIVIIAEEEGVGVSTVRALLRRQGLTRRKGDKGWNNQH